MIVIEVGNPDGASGMIDASITLSRVDAVDAAEGVDDPTAVGHRTHRAGADDVRDRVGIFDDPRRQAFAVVGSVGGASVERLRISGRLASASPSR